MLEKSSGDRGSQARSREDKIHPGGARSAAPINWEELDLAVEEAASRAAELMRILGGTQQGDSTSTGLNTPSTHSSAAPLPAPALLEMHGPAPSAPKRGKSRVQRRYYKIGEVSVIVGVPVWTLRYWERYVFQLRAVRRRNGRRYYSPYHVNIATTISRLMKEGYTLEGACRQFDSLHHPGQEALPLAVGCELLKYCQQLIAAAEHIRTISRAVSDAGDRPRSSHRTM